MYMLFNEGYLNLGVKFKWRIYFTKHHESNVLNLFL